MSGTILDALGLGEPKTQPLMHHAVVTRGPGVWQIFGGDDKQKGPNYVDEKEALEVARVLDAAVFAYHLSPAQKSALIGYYAKEPNERKALPAVGTQIVLADRELITGVLSDARLTARGEAVLLALGHGPMAEVLRVKEIERVALRARRSP